MPARQDPYRAMNFRVEIDGIAAALFSECTGLESSIDVVEYREGADSSLSVRKLPGLRKYSNITLKRGVTEDKELYRWHRNILNGELDRRNGSIVLQDDQRNDVLRWTFRSGWICRYEGPALSAKSSEVAMETIEICHEGLELDV
ncbi:MAG: phage tail protein [Actinomycetota bacterium]